MASTENRHEHIRRLLDFGSDPTPQPDYPNGAHWLAFEWIEGDTLGEALSKRQSSGRAGLRKSELRDIARAVANGLGAMHCAKPPWLHRDVKPANVLIPHGKFGEAVLADMGIAWRDNSSRFTHIAGRGPSGTDKYMAPEQFEDSELSPATDLYAIALVLWECSTGQVPHVARAHDSRDEIKYSRCTDLRLPLSFTVEGRPAENLKQVLERALQRSPGQRWPDVREFWINFHNAGVKDELWDQDISVSLPIGTVGKVVDAKEAPGSDTSTHISATVDGTSASAQEPSYEVPEVWLEQTRHVEAFVGRTELLNRTRAWLRDELGSQYRVLVGPPGQGKSAILAKLAQLESSAPDAGLVEKGAGVSLLHMIKSHGEPHRILQVLLQQAERRLGTYSPAKLYQASLEDLRNILTVALERLAKRAGHVAVILDGLDELPKGARNCEFLPTRLPAGVKWLLSSRPDANIMSVLVARLTSLDEEIVPPLNATDAGQLAESMCGFPMSTLAPLLDIVDLLKQTDGTPIVLRYQLEDLRPKVHQAIAQVESHKVSLTGLPRTVHATFREQYEAIAGRREGHVDPQAGPERAFVAKLLACAQAPLESWQLRAVLRAAAHPHSGDELRLLLDGMSQYLWAPAGKYALHHKGLADYIAREVLDEDGVAEVHGWFLSSFSDGQRSNEYYSAHVTDHLAARFHATINADLDARRAAAAAWLTEIISVRFAQSRIEAGQVYSYRRTLDELMRELSEACEDAPWLNILSSFTSERHLLEDWIEFLENQSHIMAEWPHLFTQQLRNCFDFPRLRQLGQSLQASDPVLLIQQAATTEPVQSRLKRRTVSCRNILAIGSNAVADCFATLHDDNRVRTWRISTAEPVADSDLFADATVSSAATGQDGFLVVGLSRQREPWTGTVIELSLDGNLHEVRKVDWESTTGALGRILAAGEVLFVGHHTGDDFFLLHAGKISSIQRIERSRIAEAFPLPRSTSLVETAPDGSWLVTFAKELGELAVLDGTTGRQKRGVVVSEPVYWLGVGSDGTLLLTKHDNMLKFWSLPELHYLGMLPLSHVHQLQVLIHPARALALVIDHELSQAQVLDLHTRRIIRTENWRDLPGECATLGCNGSVLIAELGVNYELDLPKAAGIWELPDSFWAPQQYEEVSTLTNLRQPVEASLQGGRCTLSRPHPECLVEFDSASGKPETAFVGATICQDTRLCVTGDDCLLLVAPHAIDTLNIELETVVHRWYCNRETFLRADRVGRKACVLVQRGILANNSGDLSAIGPLDDLSIRDFGIWSGDNDQDHDQRHDKLLAELVAQGVKIVDITSSDFAFALPRLAWSDRAVEDTFGLVTIGIDDHTVYDFRELPFSGYLHRPFVTADEEFLVLRVGVDEPHTYVIQLRSGEIVLDCVGMPLCALGAEQLLVADADGRSRIWNFVDGGVAEEIGLNVGPGAHRRYATSLAVSPDRQLFAWTALDAIVVGELLSGREIARFPAHHWEGSLAFEDNRVVNAINFDGSTLKLTLSGF